MDVYIWSSQLLILNRSKFEIDADELDNIQNAIDFAWCELYPEQELEHLEC